MGKAKWLAVLLLCAPLARGQCTGYTITSTSVNILSPADAAAQGWTTGTIVVKSSGMDSSGNPGALSHNLTQTTGTGYTASWTTQKVPLGGSVKFTAASQSPPQSWIVNQTGQVSYSTTNSGAQTFVLTVLDSSGNVLTSDRVVVTGVNGPTGQIISQDGVPTNAYYQLVSTFGGGSMMNQCSECQGGEIQKCLLATHTPLFDGTLTNPASGETQTISNATAGNVAKAQESVSGTASIMISVLPGDSPSGSTTNKIYCTMFGWVMAQQWNPGLPDIEFAVTEEEIIPSTCTLVLRFFQQGDDWGINCNVAWKKPPATADRCSVASQIPDFNPAAQWDEQNCKVPGNCNTSDMPPPNGTNASYPKYWYHASWGVRFPPGAPSPDPPIINGGAHNWTFPIYLAEGYVPAGPNQDWWILDLLNLAIPKATGLPIDCTNRDKGTRPIPAPF